jgi:hypothetical protein
MHGGNAWRQEEIGRFVLLAKCNVLVISGAAIAGTALFESTLPSCNEAPNINKWQFVSAYTWKFHIFELHNW